MIAAGQANDRELDAWVDETTVCTTTIVQVGAEALCFSMRGL
jgi:hypothetical protein